MQHSRRAVIATFERPDQAAAFARIMRRRLDSEVSCADLAAPGDPLDTHVVAVTMVPVAQVSSAVDVVTALGGVVHEPEPGTPAGY